jgi:hypothetical protein
LSSGDGDGLLILSVPPQEHSRKPYLGDIAQLVLMGATGKQSEPCNTGSSRIAHCDAICVSGSITGGATTQVSSGAHLQLRCLEVFGRELRRGWDVVGNEALAFQELTLFKHQPDST